MSSRSSVPARSLLLDLTELGLGEEGSLKLWFLPAGERN